MRFEYSGSWFRVLIEIIRLRSVIARYRVTPPRHGEEPRRRMLRKVFRRLG
jgi:hypothetical protein